MNEVRVHKKVTGPRLCPSVDHRRQTGVPRRWSIEQVFCFALCQHASLFDLFQGRAGRLIQDALLMLEQFKTCSAEQHPSH